jgi:drug/metabolite transporter (DMT)-like permease
MSLDTTGEVDGRIPRRGYAYVIAAALLWAISGAAAKFLFNNGITPLQLVQTRATLAFAFLFAWFCLFRPGLLKIAPRDIVYFMVLGTMGLAAVQFTYLLTISKIQVAAAILLEYLAPVFIAMYSIIFAREPLKLITGLAVLGATIGCYLVVGGYNLDLLSMNRVGLISGILSAISFAWYSIYGEKGMRRFSPWTILLYSTFFSALTWNSACLFWGSAPMPLDLVFNAGRYSLTVWGWLVYISLFGTMIPFGLYLVGINFIRATRASITATLEPITAGLFAFIFLGESFEAPQLLGGIFVIMSIIALQLRREIDTKTPALIRSRQQATETV